MQLTGGSPVAKPRTREEQMRTGINRITRRTALGLATSAALSLAMPALAADDIVIGASLPLSGPLAGFGSYLNWGYDHAIKEVNAAGGIEIDGEKRMLRLEVRDDKSNPNVVASNTETLISRDGAIAILASPTPPLVAAGGLVAERNRVPFITGAAPIESFKAIRKWKYGWDVFFWEPELGASPFKLVNDLALPTNKKIVILHDNGPDGQVVGGQAWPALAKEFGFEVVQNSGFPMDSMQFTSVIADAKASGADIMLVMSSTPQAVAIRKQMAAAGYAPKVLAMERGGEPQQYAEALGKLSDGSLAAAYWDPAWPFPGAADLPAAFEKETGQTWSRHIGTSYSVAKIMLDAIARAGSTDGDAINDELAKTDASYAVGPVKFDENHTSKLPIAQAQWQGGEVKIVWPKDMASGELIFPVPAGN